MLKARQGSQIQPALLRHQQPARSSQASVTTTGLASSQTLLALAMRHKLLWGPASLSKLCSLWLSVIHCHCSHRPGNLLSRQGSICCLSKAQSAVLARHNLLTLAKRHNCSWAQQASHKLCSLWLSVIH